MGLNQSSTIEFDALNSMTNNQWDQKVNDGFTFYINRFSGEWFRLCKLDIRQVQRVEAIFSRSQYTFSNTPKIIILTKNQTELIFLTQDGNFPLKKNLQELKETPEVILSQLRLLVKLAKTLIKKYGYFQVKCQMIKVCTSGQLLMWFNEDFSESIRQFPLNKTTESLKFMVQQFYWIFNDYLTKEMQKKPAENFEDFDEQLSYAIKLHLKTNPEKTFKEKLSVVMPNNQQIFKPPRYSEGPNCGSSPMYISKQHPSGDLNDRNKYFCQTTSSDSHHSPTEHSWFRNSGYSQEFSPINSNRLAHYPNNLVQFSYEAPKGSFKIKKYGQLELKHSQSSSSLVRSSPDMELKPLAPHGRFKNGQFPKGTSIPSRSHSFSNLNAIRGDRKIFRDSLKNITGIIEEKMKDSHSQLGQQSCQLSQDVEKLFQSGGLENLSVEDDVTDDALRSEIGKELDKIFN